MENRVTEIDTRLVGVLVLRQRTTFCESGETGLKQDRDYLTEWLLFGMFRYKSVKRSISYL